MILLKKWLKIKREELGYTQESFAKKVGIAKTTYSSYEQGHRNPTVQTAKKMAKILNVSWTLFLKSKYSIRIILKGGDEMPEKQKMIDFILEIMPNVKLIVELATDDQLVRLYEQAQDKLNYQLDLI